MSEEKIIFITNETNKYFKIKAEEYTQAEVDAYIKECKEIGRRLPVIFVGMGA